MYRHKIEGKYIYNPKQSQFLIDMNCKIVGTGIHSKTKCPYWIFEDNEIFDCSMTIWKQRKNNVTTQLEH